MKTVDSDVLLQVKELVKQKAIDPFEQPDQVRQLISQSLTSYSIHSSMTGQAPLGDITGLTQHVFDEIAGMGMLQKYLDDPHIEEIWINGPGRCFIARNGKSQLTTDMFSQDYIKNLVERMLKSSGRRVDLSAPFVDATLPDGSRLHVVIPSITRRYWSVNIRKFIAQAQSLDHLVTLGSLSMAAANFLEAAVVSGLNIIVSGGTQAGKTTLLNCLASAIPASERIISCEEVFELKLDLPDWVAMQTRQPSIEGTGEISLRRLVVESLRMRPSRIIVGEVRQAECLDLLIALNSGLPGMCSIHANSAREALTKLCMLPLLAGDNISHEFVIPTVASCVDLIVHTDLNTHGKRCVTEISAVSGRVESGVIEAAEIFIFSQGKLVRGLGHPPCPDRFEKAGFFLPELLNTIPAT